MKTTPIALALAAAFLGACSSHPAAPLASTTTPVTLKPGSSVEQYYPRPSALDTAGRNSMAAGDVTAAETSFQKELDINPFDPIALNNLAVAKSEEGQYTESLDLLQRATKLAPDNVEIAANLSKLRAYQSDLALAGGGSVAPADTFAGQGGTMPEPPPLWQPLAVGRPAVTSVSRAPAVRNGCFSREYAAQNREKTEVRVCDAAR